MLVLSIFHTRPWREVPKKNKNEKQRGKSQTFKSFGSQELVTGAIIIYSGNCTFSAETVADWQISGGGTVESPLIYHGLGSGNKTGCRWAMLKWGLCGILV